MIKKWYFYASLVVIITFLSLGFIPNKIETKPWFLVEKTDGSEYIFPSKEKDDYPTNNVPYTGNHLIGFKEAVAFKESQGKYRLVNSLGYMGKYQFGSKALRAIGINDNKAFLKDPALQEKAFMALLAKNKWILRYEIQKYNGKIISGIEITESGILAAALDGIVRKLEAPKAAEGMAYDDESAPTLPATFTEALDALEANDRLREHMSTGLIGIFLTMKRDEIARYNEAVPDPSTREVTDWEIKEYMEDY